MAASVGRYTEQSSKGCTKRDEDAMMDSGQNKEITNQK